MSAQAVQRASLTLAAGSKCGTAPELAERVHAPGWELSSEVSAGDALHLLADVRATAPDALAVKLRVQWPDGRGAVRDLAAQSCSAALDALLLLIRMTLDPAYGSSAEVPAAQDGNQAGQSAPADRAQPTSSTSTPQPPAVPPPATQPEPETTSAEPPAHTLVLGLLGALSSGAAPRIQPGVGLYAALHFRSSGWLQPRLRLALAHASASDVPEQAGRADFLWDGAELSLCPVGLRVGALTGHGCAAMELARVQARGHETYNPRTRARPWASAGLELQISAALGRLELQLSAALLHPLWRDRFAFAPDVFYTVPAVRFQLQLGLGLRFP